MSDSRKESLPFAGRVKEVTTHSAVGGKGLDPVAKIDYVDGETEKEMWMPLAEFHGLRAGDELELIRWERNNESGGGATGHKIIAINGNPIA